MDYRYPPIFKYIILLLCIFMFIKHLKIMSNKDNLILSISILFIIIIFDYMIIEEHPDLLDYEKEKFANIDFEEVIEDKDIEEIINTYDESDMQEVLDNTEKRKYPEKKSFFKLPTDGKKPTYEKDSGDCYRRGENIQNFYANEIF